MPVKTQSLTGWGQYPRVEAEVIRPEHLSQIQLAELKHVICRGQGRSYGDAALPIEGGAALLTERLNHFLGFDAQSGTLTAEAGVTLEEVIETFLPFGWFPKITPGTQYVSLGGCLAGDIHGKNHHHVGSFSQTVPRFTLMTADSELHDCDSSQELYWNSVGGLGLTGIITDLDIQLEAVESAYLNVQYRASSDLENTIKRLREANEAPYNVAWIDCLSTGRQLGRGIVMAGQHAAANSLPRTLKAPLRIKPRRSHTIPANCPSWLLNRTLIKQHNQHYFRQHKKKRAPELVDYEAFFYPLDRLKSWYRLYGKPGFIQYQVVFPSLHAEAGIKALLECLQASRFNAFLGVLKFLGPDNFSPLSFAREGMTLALDIPRRDPPKLLSFLHQLDDITLQHHGRVYLTKDARLSQRAFQKMYPRWKSWLDYKHQIDPKNLFCSHLSRRLGLTP